MLYIKGWLKDKNHIYQKGFEETEIIRETDKAVLVNLFGWNSYQQQEGNQDYWLPKSQLMNEEEYEEYLKDLEVKEAKRQEAFEAGKAKHSKLYDLAKANGIKGLRKDRNNTTKWLEKQLTAAGIAF